MIVCNMFENEKELFIKFRRNIPVKTTIEEFTNIFGIPSKEEIDKYGLVHKRTNDEVINQKLKILYKYREILFISDWVRYIGVTGSIAAGSAKDDDDIDIFVVVKNNRMWIYRGLMLLKMIGKSRKAKKDYQKDLFCINMIIEERGLHFEKDIFTFHELMMMKSVFNFGYKDYILKKNSWVKNYGYNSQNITINGYIPDSTTSWRRTLMNKIAYIAQVLYMIVLNHKPNIASIRNDNSNGKIQFYKRDFKDSKLALLG